MKMAKDKENFWKRFALGMDGRYTERHYWHSDKAVIDYKGRIITFDNYIHYTSSGNNSYEQEYIRVTAPFSTKDNFRFELYPKNFFSAIAKIFGAQDIATGYPEFDKAYIIKSNNSSKLKTLLADKAIRQQIESIKNINLQISDRRGIWEEKLPENEFELSFFTEGSTAGFDYLKSVYQLFTMVLDRMGKYRYTN